MRVELKAPIKYNRMNETYAYEEQGKLYLEGWEWRSELGAINY